ncbi:MAG TPA: putative Ig domain-containing protein [Verrucomicrobiae bacterium]|nr:putative Ig domain-containing protein [Verrucomicrobiae bacterium]
MKGLVAAILLLTASNVFAQPDARDSVIIESKTAATGLAGSGALLIRVDITNKDTLANFTLPVEIRTLSGTAFVVLGYPRTFAGTMNRLTSTLGNNLTFSPFLNNASPDSAIWSAFWDPSDTATAELPNSTRKVFWEMRFDSTKGAGQAAIDSAVIFDNRVGFVSIGGTSIGVNFVWGGIFMSDDWGILNCAGAGGNVLYGRPYNYDFDADASVTWSVTSGPGSINSSGVYTFSGRCPLGAIPVTVRGVSQSGTVNQCSFTLNVIDNAPSCSPAQSTVTVSHGEMATNQFNGSDPDAGDLLSFSKLSGPGTVGSNGTWSYQTSCSDVGFSPQFVHALAIDSFGGCWPGPESTSCLFALVVTNAAPTINNCPMDVVKGDTGAAFSLQLSGADIDPVDNGNLQFSLVSGPAGLTVSPSGLVQWTPSGSQWGLRSATVQVRDLCGATSNCQIDFSVSVRKGDMNADGSLTPADLIHILNCIFLLTPPPVGFQGCDLNCSGSNTQSDAVLLLNAVFSGAAFPC